MCQENTSCLVLAKLTRVRNFIYGSLGFPFITLKEKMKKKKNKKKTKPTQTQCLNVFLWNLQYRHQFQTIDAPVLKSALDFFIILQYWLYKTTSKR